ncbi:MAG: NifB/NifX family molybdenum-iron cluster-binding protein [Thiocapsa sp.]|jgi:nitrogen fixation protein NifX|nr:NifB/NifX family molybdenum-iron cluster-binding protein [Thiocapsa sp.]MCG6896893.1 NifB/NifX family molybdenum-iron cluster-binding protein [Thiocapsa sp.]MCG6985517.1 NifB/NifX family molybdenum-iron cluster-binding protein [Thiocapsa sp.]
MALERRLTLLGRSGEAAAMQTRIKAAFASSDMRQIDQHFGAAESFVVHTIEPQGHQLVEVIQFARCDMNGNENKLGARIAALQGCVVVYCEAVGASAVSQLRAQGIQPIKVSPGTSVNRLIRDLQQDLRDGPSAWLARAIAGREPNRDRRFDAMEAEGWHE